MSFAAATSTNPVGGRRIARPRSHSDVGGQWQRFGHDMARRPRVYAGIAVAVVVVLAAGILAVGMASRPAPAPSSSPAMATDHTPLGLALQGINERRHVVEDGARRLCRVVRAVPRRRLAA